MRANTVLVWSGPSVLDGSPIGLFVSGLAKKSKNAKTGNMLQTWILRLDVSPTDAIGSGLDSSICGDCKHRGQIIDGRLRNRSCYVSVKNAPLAVYRAWKRGSVPTVSLGGLAPAIIGRTIRFGSYGDPAAIPAEVWRTLADVSAGHTGYTHQWQTANLAGLCMASVDTPDETREAHARGYRTFRVKSADDVLLPREIACPASDEAGKRTSCTACRLCDGARPGDARKTIAINAHGIGAVSFARVIRLQEVRA